MRIFTVLGSLAFLISTQLFAADQGKPMLVEYLQIQEALASDSLNGVQSSAAVIAKEITKQNLGDRKLVDQISKAAMELVTAKSLKEARASFKKLSVPTVEWAKKAKPAEVEIVFCSMAHASWLQKAGQVRNPYYGKQMLECGEKSI